MPLFVCNIDLMDNSQALSAYHETAEERARAADIMRLVPTGYSTILDAGARDGYFSLLLAERFQSVTALDLTRPEVDHERIVCVLGDLTHLDFPDNSFDVVFCSEVLEHIPALQKACSEIVRVTRHTAIIGVPYRQDIRFGRVTCSSCGQIGPPWGHVNSFDEAKLERLFSPLKLVTKAFACSKADRTNALASWLIDAGGNPYGVYDKQSCIYCGQPLVAPRSRPLHQKILAAIGIRLMNAHRMLCKPHPAWIHAVFEKQARS